jgi:hypothetical protein
VTVIRQFSKAESPAISQSRNWLMTGSGTHWRFNDVRSYVSSCG